MSIRKKEPGFSFIELIVAIAIVAIIASFAVPSYSNYVKRGKVAEAIVINNEARMALVAYHAKYKKFVPNYGDISKRNLEIGLAARESYESDVVLSMWVGSRGVRGADANSAHIAIMLDPGLELSTDTGWSRLLTTIEYRDGEYIFVCNDTDAIWRSNIKEKYLPEYCHN